MIVINAIGIKKGGGKVVLDELISGIIKKNIKNVVLLLDNKIYSNKEKIETLHFHGNFLLKYYKVIKYLILKEKSNVLFVISVNSLPLLYIKSKQWILFQNRNLLLECLPKFQVKDYLKAISFWLLVKLANKKNIIIIYHLNETLIFLKKIFINSSFVRASLINNKTIQNININKKKQIKNHTITGKFIFISSETINKNNQILFESWRKVKQQLPCATLTVIGLKNIPEEFKKDKSIEIYYDLTFDETNDLIKKSNVLVFTSISECLGMPLLEAKSNNIKIIAPDIDFVWEVVSPTYIYNHKDCSSLIRVMVKSLGGKNYAEPNIVNGQQFIDLVENKENLKFI